MICRIIIRARELEAPKPTIAPDDVDDLDVSEEDEFDALESETDETVEDELRTAIEDLADDQQIELLALAMVGRGTYDASEWEDALDAANDPNGESPADQLLDMPTLAEYLDAGLAAFDLSCDGIGQID
jgi:DNA-directed RNA polymerase specialized sigma24 family protein